MVQTGLTTNFYRSLPSSSIRKAEPWKHLRSRNRDGARSILKHLWPDQSNGKKTDEDRTSFQLISILSWRGAPNCRQLRYGKAFVGSNSHPDSGGWTLIWRVLIQSQKTNRDRVSHPLCKLCRRCRLYDIRSIAKTYAIRSEYRYRNLRLVQ